MQKWLDLHKNIEFDCRISEVDTHDDEWDCSVY